MRFLLAAAAAVMLVACNQAGSGPALPKLQAGAQAPTQLTPSPPGTQQARIDQSTRTQLEQQISQLLDQYAGQFASGMTAVEGTHDEIAALQPSTDHRWVMPLHANTAYTFLGACDGDCHNVDLELIDMRTGGVVESDMLDDDYPVVTFTPTAEGQYMARLLLRDCSVAPCYTGMRVLSQAAAPPAANKG